MNETANIQESIEIIDNEKINDALCNLEEKCEKNVALEILKNIDSQTPYDIDLAYDSINKKYYFVSSEAVLKCKIPMSINEISHYGNILITYLNAKGHIFTTNVLQLGGTPERRYVTANDSMVGGVANDKILYKKVVDDIWDPVTQNNTTEELYKFAVDVRGEEYEINGICEGEGVSQECKDTLGIAENDITSAIDFKMKKPSDFTDYSILVEDVGNLYDLIDEKISEIMLPAKTQASIRDFMNHKMMYFGTVQKGSHISLQTYSDRVIILGNGEPITIPIKNLFEKEIDGIKFTSSIE